MPISQEVTKPSEESWKRLEELAQERRREGIDPTTPSSPVPPGVDPILYSRYRSKYDQYDPVEYKVEDWDPEGTVWQPPQRTPSEQMGYRFKIWLAGQMVDIQEKQKWGRQHGLNFPSTAKREIEKHIVQPWGYFTKGLEESGGIREQLGKYFTSK